MDCANICFFVITKILWYTALVNIQDIVQRESHKTQDNTSFSQMPFEFHGNMMAGNFCYKELAEKMEKIKSKLDAEADEWIQESKIWLQHDHPTATHLQRGYQQIAHQFPSTLTA